jgi:hypothetical protein
MHAAVSAKFITKGNFMSVSVRAGSLAFVVGAGLLGIALVSASAMAESGASATKRKGATVTDPRLLTRSGFLTDYDRLKKADWGDGVECWRDGGLDAKRYDKVMVSRIVVSLKPVDGKETLVDPSDLNKLTDYFSDSLVNALKPQMKVVGAPEAGTVMIAVALTSLKPTEVTRSVAGTRSPTASLPKRARAWRRADRQARRPTSAKPASKCSSSMPPRARCSASAATPRSVASTRRRWMPTRSAPG